MPSALRLLLAAGLAASASWAGAAEIAVPAGPGALQQAIDNAGPGDILRLGAGPYGTYLMCEQRGASNTKAKREPGFRPRVQSFFDAL